LAVTIFLLAAISVYLAMVAAGRANFRDPSVIGPSNFFVAGYWRFYFFWPTVIWPWAIAAVLCKLEKAYTLLIARLVGAAVSMCLIGWGVSEGNWEYAATFKRGSQIRASQGIICLQEQLLTSDHITCPSLFPNKDLTKAYVNAVTARASFIRYAPPSLRNMNRSPDLDVFTIGPTANLQIQNGELLSIRDGVIRIQGKEGPAVVFQTTQAEKMRFCRTLVLEANVTGVDNERAQFYYLPTGQTAFRETPSATAVVDGKTPITIYVTSLSGFENMLRFDPIRGAGLVQISGLRVRCLFAWPE
jgi:hypothetical protein